MTNEGAYRFSSFRLDSQNWRLRKNNEFRPLRPKTFAILRHLLDNAGQLVTKEDLFAAIWPGIKVENSALRVCMNELRQALEDDPHRPRFVETVHRLGYRFIAPVAVSDDHEEEPARLTPPPPVIVGREPELAQLLESWERAGSGKRQIVAIAGEPGIGKTTLLEMLIASPQIAGSAYIGRGQCADQYGEGGAYFPIFEAIQQICSGPSGKDAREALLTEAPNWAALMPRLSSPEMPNGDVPDQQPSAAQMISEMNAALSAIAAIRPVILICEDLHLADLPTIDLISYLARRRDPVRLMLVVTYRNSGARRDPARLGAISRELRSNPQCKALRLRGLTETDVADYILRRTDRPPSEKLVAQVHRRTGGNALFVNAIVDHFESKAGSSRQWPDDLRELGIPDNVQAMIEQQIVELPEDDQKLLKLASVAGAPGFEFSAAALAAAFEEDGASPGQDQIEERCEQLTRRISFLRATGVAQWPDGTIAAGYAFGHALYQEVLYDALNAGQRARAHLKIARRLQQAYGAKAGTTAIELAMHFERGGDNRQAAQYYNGAADVMISMGAAREALVQVEKGLDLLTSVPRDNARMQLELRLEATRMIAMIANRFHTSKIEATVERMSDLVEDLGSWGVQMLLVQGTARLVLAPMESRAAEVLIKAGLRKAETGSTRIPDAELFPLQSLAHGVLTTACMMQGKYRNAVQHAERAIETYDPNYQVPSNNSKVHSTAECAASKWFLGYPDQARKLAIEAVDFADQLPNAPALSFALARAATVFSFCRDSTRTFELIDRLLAFTADKDAGTWRSWGLFLRGALRAGTGSPSEGCRIMRGALADLDSRDGRNRPTDTTHARAILKHAEVDAGLLRPHEAMAPIQESIDECTRTGTNGMLPDMYRIMGLLKVAEENTNPNARSEAEKFFRKAIDIAHEQSARSPELRAALDLCRLWQRQGKAAQAGKLLSPLYKRFTEGHDTLDLKEAKALLAELR